MVHRRNARRPRSIGLISGSLLLTGLVLSGAPAVSNAAGRPSATSSVSAHVAGPTFPGTNCPAFPANNVWNTPITGLPVDSESATWLAAMDASSTMLHPDYGP